MPVRRTYLCDCGFQFQHFHMRRDEPAPDCPNCAGATASIPGPFAIKTNTSKAADYTYDMMEREQGLTDMNSNMREGDVAAPTYKPDQKTLEARESFIRDMQATAAQTGTPMPNENVTAPQWQTGGSWGGGFAGGITEGAAYNRRHGVDAVSLAHSAPEGQGPAGMKLKIVGAADVKE